MLPTFVGGNLDEVANLEPDIVWFAAGFGEGTRERVGKELRGNVSLVDEVSDGQKLRTEGVLDHNERTFNGKMYAIE